MLVEVMVVAALRWA